MNKQRWGGFYLILFISSFQGQASEINPHTVLKKHYLSKFIDDTQESTDADPFQEAEGYELSRYSLSERMTPLRKRTILLNYLCPECVGKQNKQNRYPVKYHSDIWVDSQVFQVDGKAHIYDATFPGMNLLGEVYGAYLLVTGATSNLNYLKQRQRLIRKIQEEKLADKLREPMEEINRHLTRGLAMFDRNHPFNALKKNMLFTEEGGIGNEIIKGGMFAPFINVPEGEGKYAVVEKAKKTMLLHNLRGDYAKSLVSVVYVMAGVQIAEGVLIHKNTKRSRNMRLRPWQGCGNCLLNSLALSVKLGGYSPLLTTTSVFLLNSIRSYHEHLELKNIKDVLSYELLAIKPFLETLLSFNDIHGLPLINFSLTVEESSMIKEMLKKMSMLDDSHSHFFQRYYTDVTITLRLLFILRGTFVRYLTNIAALQFYIAVAEGIENTDLWSFVDFDADRPGPKLSAQKLWNPLLPPKKAVPSDVKIGGKHPASFVLTGANASGKSTFLRALGINTIFMAQTLGIVAAKRFKFRPFTHFTSLMEKRDKSGRSSYETEVDAVVEAWGSNSILSQRHRSLILADELFRTTNPAEGASASTLLVRKLGSLPQVSLLVSTHFKEMNSLADESPGLFANKHMAVELQEGSNKITKMNYRLTDGPSPSANAIQLFERKIMENYPELYSE